eukprot:7015228-Karenia_brevis.AAC.1
MLPEEYQEEILETGSGEKQLEYESTKSYVLNLAQQKASSMPPRPPDVLGLKGGKECGSQDNSGGQESGVSRELF